MIASDDCRYDVVDEVKSYGSNRVGMDEVWMQHLSIIVRSTKEAGQYLTQVKLVFIVAIQQESRGPTYFCQHLQHRRARDGDVHDLVCCTSRPSGSDPSSGRWSPLASLSSTALQSSSHRVRERLRMDGTEVYVVGDIEETSLHLHVSLMQHLRARLLLGREPRRV